MSSNTPNRPDQWLDDLEAIRSLLGSETTAEPIDPDAIPVLEDIVEPGRPLQPPSQLPSQSLADAVSPRSRTDRQLDSEIRAAAELILQDVIDDFVPQIEAELKRRLQRLLKQSRPDLF